MELDEARHDRQGHQRPGGDAEPLVDLLDLVALLNELGGGRSLGLLELSGHLDCQDDARVHGDCRGFEHRSIDVQGHAEQGRGKHQSSQGPHRGRSIYQIRLRG